MVKWHNNNKESDITRRFTGFKKYRGSYESGISRPLIEIYNNRILL